MSGGQYQLSANLKRVGTDMSATVVFDLSKIASFDKSSLLKMPKVAKNLGASTDAQHQVVVPWIIDKLSSLIESPSKNDVLKYLSSETIKGVRKYNKASMDSLKNFLNGSLQPKTSLSAEHQDFPKIISALLSMANSTINKDGSIPTAYKYAVSAMDIPTPANAGSHGTKYVLVMALPGAPIDEAILSQGNVSIIPVLDNGTMDITQGNVMLKNVGLDDPLSVKIDSPLTTFMIPLGNPLPGSELYLVPHSWFGIIATPYAVIKDSTDRFKAPTHTSKYGSKSFGGPAEKVGELYSLDNEGFMNGRPYKDDPNRAAFTMEFIDPVTRKTVPISMAYNGIVQDIYGLQLAIYPDSFQANSQKVITRQMSMTRWIEEHWGDDLDSISFSGSSFGFYTYAGIADFDRSKSGAYREMQAFANFVICNGIVYQEESSAWADTGEATLKATKKNAKSVAGRSSAITTNLEDITGSNVRTYFLQSTNYGDKLQGELIVPQRFLTPVVNVTDKSWGELVGFQMMSLMKHPRSGTIKKRFPIRLTHSSMQFYGFFESFDINESADSPFRFSYSATFKVEKTVMTKGVYS